MKYLLYVDTTTDWIVSGIYKYNIETLEKISFFKASHPKESSHRLVLDIKNLLNFVNIKKVDLVVCAKGPGSFTGIRIAVSTTRNLAQFWDIPCLGLDTLEVYSSYYYFKYNSPSLVLLDAKMKKVYAGKYSKDGFSGSLDISPNELEKKFDLSSLKIFSDFNYQSSISIHTDYPEPNFLLNSKLAELNRLNTIENSYKTLTPNYIRGTYAEGKEKLSSYP
jgi:tRNA threonylcarbamoyl adenosine modification protein YeaZ